MEGKSPGGGVGGPACISNDYIKRGVRGISGMCGVQKEEERGRFTLPY